MGKYDKFSSQSRMPDKPWEIHPIWRGIGCLMMVIIPIMSYAGAVLLVRLNQENNWVPVPRELAQTITLPMIGDIPNLFGVLIVTVLLMIVGFGLLTILYSILYSIVGPPRYGPLDAPPERRRPRRRR